MAYASALPKEKYDEIHRLLTEHATSAAKSQYQEKLKKAKTQKQREACAGHYPSEWSRLLVRWSEDKASNLYVYDCLRLGYVHALEAIFDPISKAS